MIDPNLPSIQKYVVVDKSNCVKLITSNRTIAKWYQGMFDIGRFKEVKIFLKQENQMRKAKGTSVMKKKDDDKKKKQKLMGGGKVGKNMQKKGYAKGGAINRMGRMK